MQSKELVEGQPVKTGSEELWLRFRMGDATALGKIAEQYYPALLNYGLKVNRNRELLRDILQELFLDLWTRREVISMPANIKAYLFGAYRNKLYKARLSSQRLSEVDELPFDTDLAGEEATIESFLIQDEIRQITSARLDQVIGALSRRQREIVFLHFYEGMDCDQIAEVMNISRQGVYNLFSRTLKELRNLWFMSSVSVLFLISLPLLSFIEK
ncbi:RNA polymerase sigma factor [Larkinella soli]|uniref:RNA polymerase sigma factor n=1 Tax=Larkinella soli TaxID=1770527 RepID=UPI000FFC13D3|nr:sigma-70 family RNA polymerase sigma factor [Larkinella soli]